MKPWNRGHVVAGSALIALVILAGSGGTPGNAQAERAESFKTSKAAGNANGKLVFMLTTGFEDTWEMRLCLEDIKAAQASGHLEDVIWLVRGRGVDALGRPEGVLTRFVVVGKARTLLELLRSQVPAAVVLTAQALAILDAEGAYDRLSLVDFSRDVLAEESNRLLVLRDRESGWADLGSPPRVLETLTRNGIHPDWVRDETSLSMA